MSCLRVSGAFFALGLSIILPSVVPSGVPFLSSVARNANADVRSTFNEWQQKRALAKAAAGLEGKLEKAPVAAASELYLLEMRALGLLSDIGNRKDLTDGARSEKLSAQRANIQRILRLSERVREFAIKKADEVLAPEPLRQILSEEGVDTYGPIYRGLPELEAGKTRTSKDAIEAMESAQRQKGINTSRVYDISDESVAGLESGQLAEWVQLAGTDHLVFGKDGAKHPVMARGKKVRGAGSFKIFKNASGEVLLAVVSPTSGNYKPGLGSTEALVQGLVHAGVSEGRIVVSETAPADTSNVKLLMRARQHSKEQIKTRIAKLEARAKPKANRLARVLRAIPLPRMPWSETKQKAKSKTKSISKKPSRTVIKRPKSKSYLAGTAKIKKALLLKRAKKAKRARRARRARR